MRLPAVIRPRPLRLAQLEKMVLRHDRFAANLRDSAGVVDALARVVFARDPEAGERFRDAGALADHLRAILGLQ